MLDVLMDTLCLEEPFFRKSLTSPFVLIPSHFLKTYFHIKKKTSTKMYTPF